MFLSDYMIFNESDNAIIEPDEERLQQLGLSCRIQLCFPKEHEHAAWLWMIENSAPKSTISSFNDRLVELRNYYWTLAFEQHTIMSIYGDESVIHKTISILYGTSVLLLRTVEIRLFYLHYFNDMCKLHADFNSNDLAFVCMVACSVNHSIHDKCLEYITRQEAADKKNKKRLPRPNRQLACPAVATDPYRVGYIIGQLKYTIDFFDKDFGTMEAGMTDSHGFVLSMSKKLTMLIGAIDKLCTVDELDKQVLQDSASA